MNKISKQLIRISKELITLDKNELLSKVNRSLIGPTTISLLKGKIKDDFIKQFDLENMQETKEWTKKFYESCNNIIDSIPQRLKDQFNQMNEQQFLQLFTKKIPQITKIAQILESLYTDLVTIIKQIKPTNDLDFSDWKL